MAHFDVQRYVRRPRITAYSGVVLTIRMIKAAPGDPAANELEALEELRDAAQAVQDTVEAHQVHAPANLRPLDRRFDGAWACLNGHLVAATRMIGEPEAEVAARLIATLFPEGLIFLSMKFEPQWLHSRILLQLIDNQKLEPELIELCGERCMSHLRTCHAQLGKALGLDGSETTPPPVLPLVGDRVAELADAIASYGRVLAGGVNTKQPQSIARFYAAVAPLDAHRAKYRSTTNTPDDDADEQDAIAEEDDELSIDTPLPPLPKPADD